MIRAWIARNVIAMDPHPEYSRLDRIDGLQQQPSGLWINNERFNHAAQELAA